MKAVEVNQIEIPPHVKTLEKEPSQESEERERDVKCDESVSDKREKEIQIRRKTTSISLKSSYRERS